MSSGLYILSLVVRCVILFAVLHEYGWKAYGLTWLYGLLMAICESMGVIA